METPELPPEILLQVMAHATRLDDLASWRAVSHQTRDLVDTSPALWREVILRVLRSINVDAEAWKRQDSITPPATASAEEQVAFYLDFVRSRNLVALGRSREALVNALASEEAYATFGADPGDVAKILASVRLCIDYQSQGADFYDPDNALEADSYGSPWDTDQANPATPFVEAHPWLKDLHASLGNVHPGGFAIRFSALQWFAAAGPRLVRFLLAGGYAGASEPTEAETNRLAETVKKAAVKKNDGQDVGDVPTPGWAPIVFRTVANLPSGTEMRKFAVGTAAEAILGSASYAPLNFDAFWAEHDDLLVMTAVPVPSAGDGNDSEVSSLKLAVQGVVDYILCEILELSGNRAYGRRDLHAGCVVGSIRSDVELRTLFDAVWPAGDDGDLGWRNMFGATVSESRVNGNLCWKTGLPQPDGVGYSAQIHLDPLANTLAADEFNLPASGNLAIFTSEDLSRAEIVHVHWAEDEEIRTIRILDDDEWSSPSQIIGTNPREYLTLGNQEDLDLTSGGYADYDAYTALKKMMESFVIPATDENEFRRHAFHIFGYPHYYQGNDGYPTETQILMQYDAFGGDAAIYIFSEKENYLERNYDKFEGTHQM